MTVTLILARETDKARLYENKAGVQIWVPKSVIRKCLKHPAKPGEAEIHELDIESWFARTKGFGE